MNALASVVGSLNPTMATHPTIKHVPLAGLVVIAVISGRHVGRMFSC